MRNLIHLLALAVLGLALAPGVARADEPAAQLMLTFAGGFLGQASASGGGLSLDQDNELTYGGGLRFEGVFGRYFAAGLRLEVDSSEVESGGPLSLGRNPRMDVGLYAKARFPLEDGSATYYLAALGGYSRSFASDDNGFHVGAVGGVEALIAPHVGGLVELGWLRHQIGSVDLEGVDGTPALDVSTNQFFVTVGYFIPF